MDFVEPWLIAPISALISILVGFYLYRYVNKQDSGTERMREISEAIKEGADAFIKREYTILAIFVLIVAILLGIFLPKPLWDVEVNIARNLSLALA
jgi:K(+)-stimulated pyrophosphate-energized sodium pump